MELYLEPEIAKKYAGRCKKTGRFLPGTKPWNHGQKGLFTNNSATKFQKGHMPHNTLSNGVLSLRYHAKEKKHYLYIREEKGKWVLLNRHVWQRVHGPIPKGYCIAYKDGNIMNCQIENLFMLSRAENMRRNQNREKAAQSMKKRYHIEKLRKIYGLKCETKLLDRGKRQ